MPAQAAIVINDGQGSPVAHTFNPNGAMQLPDGKIAAEWVDRGAAIRVGYCYIQEQFSPINVNGIEKARFVIKKVSTETLSGATAPTKAFESDIILEFWIHQRESTQGLADLVAYAKNFAAHAYVASTVNNRERPWG